MKIHFQERFDVGEGAFLTRELETVEARVHEVKTAELKGMELVPQDTNFDPDTTLTITSRQYENIGEAAIVGVSVSAKSAPRVEIKFSETTTRVAKVFDSYAYTVHELRASVKLGRSLDQFRANAAKKAIDIKLDKICQVGSPVEGLTGLFNIPNVNTYTIPADSPTSTTYWADKSALAVIRDMNKAVQKMIDDTKEVEKPDTMVLPGSVFGYITTTPWSTGSDMTIAKFFMANNPYIKSIVSWYALEAAYLDALVAAGATGTGHTTGKARGFVYRRDPDVVKMNMVKQFTNDAPQLHDDEYTVRCEALTGGVVSQLPKGILVFEAI